MRAYEFLIEEQSNVSATNRGSANKKSKSIHNNHKSSIKGMTTYPEIPSHYYDFYRFGVYMAGSPDEQDMDKASPYANQLLTLAYTDADAEIIDKSKKAMGFKGKTLSSNHSKETTDINKLSPMAKIKKNKYGV
jgi:hypothetical protein